MPNLLPSFPASWPLAIAKGSYPGHSVIHKFGSALVTTTLAPITRSGFYRTPTALTALEVVAGSDNDTANGSGAREVTLTGLGAGWVEVSQSVATSGTSAAAVPTSLLRLYRWYVSASGTYATQSAGSHASALTVREAGGGQTWSTIDLVGGLGRGQSLIGAFTVPSGKTAWLTALSATVDTSKTVSLFFFQRPAASDVAAPYSGAMRVIRQAYGLSSDWAAVITIPDGPFVGPCDLGVLGQVSLTSAEVAVDFELILVDN